MVAEWQRPCVAAYLVAGHTSFARLSAIADILKANLCTHCCSMVRQVLASHLFLGRVAVALKSGTRLRIDATSPTGEPPFHQPHTHTHTTAHAPPHTHTHVRSKEG